MDHYPIGLAARINFFVCDSTTWSPECKIFILSRMIHSAGNIKPVFVVNPNESVDMYQPNATLTDLRKTTPTGEEQLWKMQVRKKAYFVINKTRIQRMPKGSNMEKAHLIDELTVLTDEIKATRIEKLKAALHIG